METSEEKVGVKPAGATQKTFHIPQYPFDSCLKYVKHKGQYRLEDPRYQLRNNLLAAVGVFEFANAGDFAANVWNTVSVPRFAIALMALGGIFALFMTYFAYRAITLSWRNVKGLQCERRFLKGALEKVQKQYSDVGEDSLVILQALLDVNHRESGVGIIDRIVMDSLMGLGATMVGIGTFLAIDGADRRVWLASNYLPANIGNGPLALLGLVSLG